MISHSDQLSKGITFSFLIERAEYESFVAQLETEREKVVKEYADNPDGLGSADKKIS